MSPEQELFDLLARFVGILDADLLADEPELSAILGQLLQILEPKPAMLPMHIIEKLSIIDNKIERFRAAAKELQAYDPGKLKQLADSLRESGLLKGETNVSK